MINLLARKDRLQQFRRLQNEMGWQLPEPEIIEAVDGRRTGVPDYWTQGAGAWGCRQSHIAVLQRATGPTLVLEDDLVWTEQSWPRLSSFLASVPADWDMLMLGGQHMRKPTVVSEQVVRCTSTHRTHAYIIRRPRDLLALWYRPANRHIDWQLTDFCRSHKVYAPSTWIFGQGQGKSDISGRLDSERYWPR